MAQVDTSAALGEGVRVGPFAVVGAGVRVGDGCVLHAHSTVAGDTTLEAGVEVFPYAYVGAPPQDLKHRPGDRSELVVGRGSRLREHCTVSGGTALGGGVTRVGSHCLVMTGAHVGHDCAVGDGVVLANGACLAGHVHVGAGAIVGGQAAVHQWVTVGERAIVGGKCAVDADVVPLGAVLRAAPRLSVNVIGLRRAGVAPPAARALVRAFRYLFGVGGGPLAAFALGGEAGTVAERAAVLRGALGGALGGGSPVASPVVEGSPVVEASPELELLLSFVETCGERPRSRLMLPV